LINIQTYFEAPIILFLLEKETQAVRLSKINPYDVHIFPVWSTLIVIQL